MPNKWWIPKASASGAQLTGFSNSSLQPPEVPQVQNTNYGRIQRQGAELRRYIADARKPNCPIFPNTLTIHDLARSDSIEVSQESPLDPDLTNLFHNLNLPPPSLPHHDSVYRTFELDSNALEWRGFIGPEVIIIEDIDRHSENAPHMSEVSLAMYQADYLIDTLRHVVLTHVVEEDTLNVLKSELHRNVVCSDTWWRSWEYGTPEYDALMGTRIGKLVAYMVLGGFRRGSKRISRINTVKNPRGTSANFHFEII
jgi:hypothetical protein